MADPARRGPPLPLALAFVACHEIYQDDRTGAAVLIRPTSHEPCPQFPTRVRMSLWAEFAGSHGSYQPALRLFDDSDETVWEWTAPAPMQPANPLVPATVVFNDVLISVPRAGKYRLVLFFKNEELAHRHMWFGSTEALTKRGNP